MFTTTRNSIRKCASFAAGFVTNGPTGGGAFDEGLGAILMASLLGALFGLIFGLMTKHLVRCFAFLSGHRLGGHSWTILGAVLGAIVCAWLAVTDKDGED